MVGYELSEVKLSRVCGVTHTADTCGEFRVVRHPDNTYLLTYLLHGAESFLRS